MAGHDGDAISLNRIDLNLLVAFDALMTERNLTRAAEELWVGQPAMSAALTRVRKLFDDPILIREGRHWVATPTAEALFGPIHEALLSISSVLGSRRSFAPESDARTFTLIASDYVVFTLLQPFFSSAAREAPHVQFKVKQPEPFDEDPADHLRGGSADVLILPREAAGEQRQLSSQDLFTDRYVAAVDADNPDVGDELSLEQFLSMPYVAFSSGPRLSLVELQLAALGVSRPIDITTRSFVIVPFLLTGTRSVSLIHERLGRKVQGKANLKLLEPPVALSPLAETMYWNPRQTDDPGHRWLRQRLYETAQGLQSASELKLLNSA